MSTPAYDDPVGRTRLAWGRTLLTIIGVCLLIGRGAVISGRLWLLFVLVPVALGLIGLGLARQARSRSMPDDALLGIPAWRSLGVSGRPMDRWFVMSMSAGVAVIAAVAVLSVGS